jgi:plastin-1
LPRANRKYPQFQQNEIFTLQDAFRKLDVDDKGYLDEATVIKATQQSERQPYDAVRQALKEVELDSSRRVEIEDYIDVRIRRPFHMLQGGIELQLNYANVI